MERRLDERVVGEPPEELRQSFPVAGSVVASEQLPCVFAGFDQLRIERVVELPRHHLLPGGHGRITLSASCSVRATSSAFGRSLSSTCRTASSSGRPPAI